MTQKIKEFAEKKFPSNDETYYHDVAIQNAFKGGILIGAEFAEWVSDNGWILCIEKTTWSNYERTDIGEYSTTTELLDIFITEKMKENESKNS